MTALGGYDSGLNANGMARSEPDELDLLHLRRNAGDSGAGREQYSHRELHARQRPEREHGRRGRIGGLLGRSDGYSSGNWTSHNFYHADGNGNITALVNTSQSLSAQYRYDAFGNLTSSSGTMADANNYRYSSKESLRYVPPWGAGYGPTEFYYYGYRFYTPAWQRWLNRDPIQEAGGINLYEFVGNNPIEELDPFGLQITITGPGAPENGAVYLPTNAPLPPFDIGPPPNTLPTGPLGIGALGGTLSGNGIPGYLGSGYKSCEAKDSGQRTDIQYYNGPSCPDGTPQKCQKWVECKQVRPTRSGGKDTGYSWVPQQHCNPCKTACNPNSQ